MLSGRIVDDRHPAQAVGGGNVRAECCVRARVRVACTYVHVKGSARARKGPRMRVKEIPLRVRTYT